MSIVFQNQLRGILENIGFSEDCMIPQIFNYHGPDFKLDVVSQIRSCMPMFLEFKAKCYQGFATYNLLQVILI